MPDRPGALPGPRPSPLDAWSATPGAPSDGLDRPGTTLDASSATPDRWSNPLDIRGKTLGR